jgi:hypothetical protein
MKKKVFYNIDCWLRFNENGAKLSATAESLRQLIIVKPEKFSVFSVNDLVSNYKT